MNSLTTPRHSPTISKSANIGGKKMARNTINNNTPTKFFKSRPLGQTNLAGPMR